MSDLRNYIGGTIEDPCPTGPTAFKIFGSLYCNAEDYAAWKTRLQVMYKQALLPTWNAYLATLPKGVEGSGGGKSLCRGIASGRKNWEKG